MEVQNKQRSFLVTMICSFYFVSWAFGLIAFMATLLIRIGSQFPSFWDILNQINLIFIGTQVTVSAVTWLIAIGLVVGIIGYWLVQKWGVIVYSASTIALFIVVALPIAGTAPSKILYAATLLYVLAAAFAVNVVMIVLGIMNFKKMK